MLIILFSNQQLFNVALIIDRFINILPWEEYYMLNADADTEEEICFLSLSSLQRHCLVQSEFTICCHTLQYALRTTYCTKCYKYWLDYNIIIFLLHHTYSTSTTFSNIYVPLYVFFLSLLVMKEKYPRHVPKNGNNLRWCFVNDIN